MENRKRSKIFQVVIYNSLFNHFVSNKLFTPSQLDFLPGESCIAQLLSILYKLKSYGVEGELLSL